MLKKMVSGLCFFLPSRPTRFLYRLCGHRIGRNVRIPVLSFVHAEEMIIGNDVDIRRFVYISVRKLYLGANTIVSYACQIKGAAAFSCKDNCFFGIHSLIHCKENVSFGFYSGLGPRCTVYTHGSFLPVTMGYPAKFEPVIIDDYVWIAMEVTVLPGAQIEGNCIINPGVVIQGKVKSNSILQLDPKSYVLHDLSRLQVISKKNPSFWHHRIITGFLDSRRASFQHEAGTANYTVPGRYTFTSRPETNTIELHIRKEKFMYDLERFYADESPRRVHKEFLAFIRLHYGLTLRTRYR